MTITPMVILSPGVFCRGEESSTLMRMLDLVLLIMIYRAPSLWDFVRLRRTQDDEDYVVMLNGVPQGRSEASSTLTFTTQDGTSAGSFARLMQSQGSLRMTVTRCTTVHWSF
jgi:hypothetical protein